METVQIVLDKGLRHFLFVDRDRCTCNIHCPRSASEVVIGESDGMKVPCAVNLHNTITVSQDLLRRRVARLSSPRMTEICAALSFCLGCDNLKPGLY